MFLDVNSCWNNIWSLWWIRSSHNNEKRTFSDEIHMLIDTCLLSELYKCFTVILDLNFQNYPQQYFAWNSQTEQPVPTKFLKTHTLTVTIFLRGKNTPDLPLNPLPSSFTSDLSKHQSHRPHELFWRELKGDAIGPFHTVKSFCHQQIWSALRYECFFYLIINVANLFFFLILS